MQKHEKHLLMWGNGFFLENIWIQSEFWRKFIWKMNNVQNSDGWKTFWWKIVGGKLWWKPFGGQMLWQSPAVVASQAEEMARSSPGENLLRLVDCASTPDYHHHHHHHYHLDHCHHLHQRYHHHHYHYHHHHHHNH